MGVLVLCVTLLDERKAPIHKSDFVRHEYTRRVACRRDISICNSVHFICSKPSGKDILLERISFLVVGFHIYRSKDETLSRDLKNEIIYWPPCGANPLLELALSQPSGVQWRTKSRLSGCSTTNGARRNRLLE